MSVGGGGGGGGRGVNMGLKFQLLGNQKLLAKSINFDMPDSAAKLKIFLSEVKLVLHSLDYA